MTVCEDTIAYDNPIVVNLGSSIQDTVVYTDGDGNTIDVSGDAFDISESVPVDLASQIVLSKVDPLADPVNGRIALSLDAADITAIQSNFGLGTHAWFRLRRTPSGGAARTTPKIWIRIR